MRQQQLFLLQQQQAQQQQQQQEEMMRQQQLFQQQQQQQQQLQNQSLFAPSQPVTAQPTGFGHVPLPHLPSLIKSHDLPQVKQPIRAFPCSIRIQPLPQTYPATRPKPIIQPPRNVRDALSLPRLLLVFLPCAHTKSEPEPEPADPG